ncbi:MAG: rRNA maturation RNase YbeY [Melioribacteraceae bacterium]|nr:rRNA maturation RNase YbeY [Melioribacteraceae bacterium]
MKGLKIFTEKGIRVNKKKIDLIIQKLKDEIEFKIESFELNFVNSETISEINKKFLNHNGSTDIITFNYSEEKYRFDAEIFISIPDAIENSKKYKVKSDNEIGRLIIHGVLHLLGYDDTTPNKKKTMKKYENYFVNKLDKIFKGILL